MAEVGGVIPPSCGVISGMDPRSGAPFVNQVFLGFGAGAAAPETDAWITIAHVGNAGLCYQDSIEVDEMVFPITVKGRHFITDSGGAGRQRGGAGAFVEFGPVDGCRLEVGYVSNGAVNPANGARGGGPGAVARQYRRNHNGELVALEACAQAAVAPGETMVSISAGGGGYAAPCAREPERVAHDVREKWVSPEAARDIYRVALDSAGNVDEAETRRLRAATATESGARVQTAAE